jgi:hypothetical protein
LRERNFAELLRRRRPGAAPGSSRTDLTLPSDRLAKAAANLPAETRRRNSEVRQLQWLVIGKIFQVFPVQSSDSAPL